jgi:hypothetical protein
LDGGGELRDALADFLLVVYRGILRESIFKESLECGPVHSLEFGEFQGVLEG